MAASHKKVGLSGSVLTGAWHVCAFFHDKEEEYRTLLPFIAEGFSEGDKAVHIVDAHYRDEHFRRLKEAEIEVSAAERRGQLEVRDWNDSHATGSFDQDSVIAQIDQILSDARRQGYSRTRFIGEMDWTDLMQLSVETLISFEARVNDILSKYGDYVICAYDLSRFSGAVVVDVMRTHPAAIIGGIFQQNPFYVPADQILEELREREEAAR